MESHKEDNVRMCDEDGGGAMWEDEAGKLKHYDSY